MLELAITVAIIGVLAAVTIPNWASTARNKKYDPEITAMFTEIGAREEQYKQELGNGEYLPTGTACPSAPMPNGSDFNMNCVTGATAWVTLRVSPTDSSIRCSYQVFTGDSTSPPNSATIAPCLLPHNGTGTVAGSWYEIMATCDMDGNGGTNATFCINSWDTKQHNLNYGS